VIVVTGDVVTGEGCIKVNERSYENLMSARLYKVSYMMENNFKLTKSIIGLTNFVANT